MKPGYRKKTTHISFSADETGFINKNQAGELIRELATKQEFYEIEPARVTKVNLDFYDDDFPKLEDGTPNYNLLGSVYARLLYSQKGSGKLIDTPINPLVGEIVNVAEYENQLYYYNPLNVNGLVSSNSDITNDGKVVFDLIKYNRKVIPKQGDTVVQGRFGHSIHFGSDINNVLPNIKISAGQTGDYENLNTAKRVNPTFPHITDINNDQASIHITTNEHTPLKTGAKSDAKGPDTMFGEKKLSNIVLSADSLIFNSKKKSLFMFSPTHIVASSKLITLESGQGRVELGRVGADNPVAGHKELKDVFSEVIEVMYEMTDQILDAMETLNAYALEGRSSESTVYGRIDMNKEKITRKLELVETTIKDKLSQNNNVFIGGKSKQTDDVKWEKK